MALAVVTGSGGLVGSEAVRALVERGYEVIGVENDMRARFFGPGGSTAGVTRSLEQGLDGFRRVDLDIRDREGVDRLVARLTGRLDIIVHAAAQPSHDWAASDPHTDFDVNARGTLNLLEAARSHASDATFVFMSTNKVYGDRPNGLPLHELDGRLDLPEDHRWYGGIDTAMSLDRCTHSLFGVSKAAADLAVQEYGRYFHMPTVAFRGGCLTGPQHAGVELHGFLAYLMRRAMTGTPYTVFGHGGKQVRDNLHAYDVVEAALAFHARPRPGAVYNLGGGRSNSVSVIEAIELCERLAERDLEWTIREAPRVGDHRWWITDLTEFRRDYPEWSVTVSLEQILRDIRDSNIEAASSP